MIETNQELLRATEELIAFFDLRGDSAASEELRRGMGAINGLGDGWGAFLDSVHAVKKRCGSRLEEPHRSKLKALHRAAYRAVYRGSLGRWWKYL